MDASNRKKFYTDSKIEVWRQNIHRGQNTAKDDEPSISVNESELVELYEQLDSISMVHPKEHAKECPSERAAKDTQQRLLEHCERKRTLEGFRTPKRCGLLLNKDLINLIASYHPYGFEEQTLEEIMMASEEIRRMAKKIIAKFDVDENKPPNGQYILWSLDALVKIIKFCRVFTVGRTLSTVGFLPTNFDRKISTSIADRMIYEEDNFMTSNEEIVFIADCYFNRICLCLNDAHRKYGAEAPTTNKLAQALRADRVASSLLVKLFILLDDANDLRRENKQTRVQQGYDAFEVLRLPYQYPESIAEGHEKMLLYLVSSPYASRLKKTIATKDRSAPINEETAIVAPGLLSTPEFIWEKINHELGPSLENWERDSIASDQDQKTWRERKWRLFEESKYRDEDGKCFLQNCISGFLVSCRKMAVKLRTNADDEYYAMHLEMTEKLQKFADERRKEIGGEKPTRPTVSLPQPYAVQGREQHLRPNMLVLRCTEGIQAFDRVIIQDGKWFELNHKSYFERRRFFFDDAPGLKPTNHQKLMKNEGYRLRCYYVDYGYHEEVDIADLYFAPKFALQCPATALPILMADPEITDDQELAMASKFCSDKNWSTCHRYEYLSGFVTANRSDSNRYPLFNIRLLKESLVDEEGNDCAPIGLFLRLDTNRGMNGCEPYFAQDYTNFKIASLSKKYDFTCYPK